MNRHNAVTEVSLPKRGESWPVLHTDGVVFGILLLATWVVILCKRARARRVRRVWLGRRLSACEVHWRN